MVADLSTSIPLFQATLVALTLWLGVVKWVLNSDEDVDIMGVGIITGGTALLWWALLFFSGAIMVATDSVAIQRGVTGASSLMLMITGLSVAWLASELDEPKWKVLCFQLLIGLSAAIFTIIFQRVLTAVFFSA
ncbi:hypothetical protein [Halobacterium wangiae]|uniref:hypothetical protein n=1 Tax=Halobacterium wangiae TaxID=2902623 RepID=UPI001E2F9DF0|nr:hypothetical protein [Halobacterium wangiae]